MSWISRDEINAIVQQVVSHPCDLPDEVGRGPRVRNVGCVVNRAPDIKTVVFARIETAVVEATHSPFLRRAQPRNELNASVVADAR